MQKVLSFISIILVLSLVCVACGSNSSTDKNTGKSEVAAKVSDIKDPVKLPASMVWSIYSVGSGTYNDYAAVANAFTKKYGASIRLLPSGTSIGRMTPLKEKLADIARVGEEYWYSFEGIEEYAIPSWGPQDVRLVWPSGVAIGLAVRADSGIKTIADLKGKTIPRQIANPSVQNKTVGYLAYGGLTVNDVKWYDVSYNDAANAMKNGIVDAVCFNPYASNMHELYSAVKFSWFDINDKNSWNNVLKVAPSTNPIVVRDGIVGMTEKDQPITMMGYNVPAIAYNSVVDNDVIYNFCKAMDDAYDEYKTATIPNSWLNTKNSAVMHPTVVPFHDSLVRYLKDIGKWTADDQAIQDKLVTRGEAIRKLWTKFMSETDAKDPEFSKKWLNYKQANGLGS